MNINYIYGETLQYKKYRKSHNDSLFSHLDAFDLNSSHISFEKGGQRTFTCLIYLNDLNESDGGGQHGQS